MTIPITLAITGFKDRNIYEKAFFLSCPQCMYHDDPLIRVCVKLFKDENNLEDGDHVTVSLNFRWDNEKSGKS